MLHLSDHNRIAMNLDSMIEDLSRWEEETPKNRRTLQALRKKCLETRKTMAESLAEERHCTVEDTPYFNQEVRRRIHHGDIQ